MKYAIILIMMILGSMLTAVLISNLTTGPSEYELNLIDQDTIEIKSNLSGETYLIPRDSILKTLDNDNL